METKGRKQVPLRRFIEVLQESSRDNPETHYGVNVSVRNSGYVPGVGYSYERTYTSGNAVSVDLKYDDDRRSSEGKDEVGDAIDYFKYELGDDFEVITTNSGEASARLNVCFVK